MDETSTTAPTPEPDPMKDGGEAIISNATPSDVEFGALIGGIFAYLTGAAPARHVAMFMDTATGLRDQLRVKDLAYKAERFLELNPNASDAELGELAKLRPEQIGPYLEQMRRDDRERLGKVIEFRGPRAAPEHG